MTTIQTILLALVQGITEFLPISSSAHLILVPYLFGWQDQGLRFDIAANTGTLLAVVLYFRQDLFRFSRAGLTSLKVAPEGWSQDARMAWFLAAATVPVAVCGLVFYEWISTVGRQPQVLATTSIVFGLLLWWADRRGKRSRPVETVRWRDAAGVGLAQALALIPGTSRSGVTMTAGLFAGLDREAAARFSFLLAVPVGLLAAVKDIVDLVRNPLLAGELGQLSLGLAVSAASAYLVIGWLLAWVRRQDLTIFVVYRILLGGAILVLMR
jgi:undecaprenyl-diphosphatase